MKLIIQSVLLTWVLLLLLPVTLISKTLSISYFVVPPHITYDYKSAEVSGAAYDFLNQKIAPEMGVEFVWEQYPIPVPRQLRMLKKGQIDASIIFAKNDERSQIAQYPHSSFYDSRPVLALLKCHPLNQVRNVEDILDLDIGYNYQGYLSPFMKDKRIHLSNISHKDWITQNLRKLLKRRIDAMYVVEAPPILYAARRYNSGNKIKLIYLPEPKIPIFTVFSKKAAPDLKDKYDAAFKKVGGRSTYYKQFLGKFIDPDNL
jgi:polar amino acid transport system substrate-binding protein